MSIDRLLGCEKRWKQQITSRCQPGHQAKDSSSRSCKKTARLQGPGTAGMMEWRCQARLAIGRSKRRRRAAGLNALAPCVDGCAGGLTGCHALEEGRLRGAWPTKGTHGTPVSDEKTASLGNGWQGAHRAGTLTRTESASARLADLADRTVVRTSHSRKCLKATQ